MIPAISEARDHSSRRKIMEMSAEELHFQIDSWKLTDEHNPHDLGLWKGSRNEYDVPTYSTAPTFPLNNK